MALSGNYHSYPVSQFGLYVEWSATQNVIGNYSDVTQNIYLSYYTLNVSSRSDSTSSINGSKVTYSSPAISRSSASSWTKKLLKTHTVRVNHKSDGTANGIPLSATWRFGGTYSGKSIGTITASTTINLNSIVRGSIINSVNAVTIDDASPVVKMNVFVPNTNYTHTLILQNKSNNATIATISNLKLINGANTINLSSIRTAVLNSISNVKSRVDRFVLRSYSGSTQIGSNSTKDVTIQTTAANSGPVFNAFSYLDTNGKTVAITEDNQKIIQNASTLRINATAAEAKNGASISSYSVAINGVTKSQVNPSNIDFGSINANGTIPIVVTAIDSRGYTSSATRNIDIIPYTKITIDDYNIERVNGFEPSINFLLKGSISQFSIGGVNKNAFRKLSYRYRVSSSSSWVGPIVISGVISSPSGYEYSASPLSGISFEQDYSYVIEVTVEDNLSYESITVNLMQAIPLMSFMKKMVGINKKTPTSALDVNGIIKMNGRSVLGYQRRLTGTEDLNDVVDSGIYGTSPNIEIIAPDNCHYPMKIRDNMGVAGTLIVIVGLNNIIQMYFPYNLDGTGYHGYARTYYAYGNTWSAWKQMTL